MFSMAAASLAILARPCAFERLRSAMTRRSIVWIASCVEKPTLLTTATGLLFAESELSPFNLNQRPHGERHLVGVSRVLGGADRPVLHPAERLLYRVR